jgi:hypothetical protein
MNNDTKIPSMHVSQMWALFRRWTFYERDECTFMDFMKRAEPTVLMDDAVVVKSHGIWLAIETNTQGECHS